VADALWTLREVGLGRGGSARLKSVTLRIEPGVTAVLGCSGAGKSSLLNLLVGFERPDRGEIAARALTNGHPVPVYWVPQDGGLWPHMTVRRHLEAVASRNGTDPVEELLDAFEMRRRADAHPDELSLGERTRLAVMRGLIARPTVLVMDEPLASVDVARSGRFWRTIRDLAARHETSLVYATHSPERVIGEADRVICLRDGAVLYDGPVDELYERPPTREAAECLGEINWFTPEESRLWLNREESADRGYRPEHIEVVAAPGSEFRVECSRGRGATTDTEMLYETEGRKRSFIHRSARTPLKAGMRAAVKLLMCLLVFLLASCRPSEDRPLTFSRVDARPMRPEGPKVPVPRAVAVGKDDCLAVMDTAGRIGIFDKEGKFLREMRMPESKAGTPEGICFMPDGTLAAADTHYQRVVFFAEDGSVARMLGKEGRGPGEFIYPVGLALDDKGVLYVCEYGSNDRIQKIAPDGTFLGAFGTFGTGPKDLQRPSGLFWRAGKVYVADAINNRIQVFTDAGDFIGTLGGEHPPALHYPYDICPGPGDSMYVIEYGAGRLTQLDSEGRVLGRFGRTGPEYGEFRTPWGVTRDSQGRLFVADTKNARIVELTP
jgi:ABC-type multidrug transport system ATPase subunit